MKEHCGKYESLFIFSNKEKLYEHIKVCDECKEEHLKMLKLSEVLKEVRPYYRRKKNIKNIYKIAALFCVSVLSFLVIQLATPYSSINETIANVTGSNITYEQMGIPVDDYGFIMVDE